MTGTLKYLHVTPIFFLADPKESCTDARRTETCAASINRHVDASRDALLVICYFVLFVLRALCFLLSVFLPYKQRGGGRDARLSLFIHLSLFSRPPGGLAIVKNSFFGLIINTLNVRNNNKQ